MVSSSAVYIIMSLSCSNAGNLQPLIFHWISMFHKMDPSFLPSQCAIASPAHPAQHDRHFDHTPIQHSRCTPHAPAYPNKNTFSCRILHSVAEQQSPNTPGASHERSEMNGTKTAAAVNKAKAANLATSNGSNGNNATKRRKGQDLLPIVTLESQDDSQDSSPASSLR
jgi:hypothetical protein